ncbi:right-handed parallel beta-helix repeat-containing protein [Sorangium sp. So ce854]|uniref:right-handed parallel beta-helix repeat-containing protein n=1 Tax=Sorangium sp. So ce854 TaxID=3133322 RepID=UPI003F6195F6
MTQRKALYMKLVVLAGGLGMLLGCGSSDLPAACPPEDEIRGACAGVPRAPVCEAEMCAGEIPCAAILQVASDAALQSTAAGATSGACIALAPGSYGAVALPGGVSLLGRSADDVAVGEVTVGAGEGAVLRGFRASSLSIQGATGATIASVRVSGSPQDGVVVGPGSSVALIRSTIEGASRYGVHAVDPRAVSLDEVVIDASGGPGLWVASSSDCAAPPERPALDMKRSIVRGAHIAGLALFGVKATVRSVDVLATKVGESFSYGLGGGGISVASCSEIDAKGLRVHDNSLYGVLVDGSTGTIGGTGPDEEAEIHRNVRGIWIQNVTESFTLENAQLDQNKGAGIGLSGESRGVIICRSSVSRTQLKSMDTIDDISIRDVGHGLVWTERSSASVVDVELSSNALASVLIDGEADGELSRVVLSGGDETLGIVQQNVTSGAQKPLVTGGTPSLRFAEGEVHPVPAAPEVLSKAL